MNETDKRILAFHFANLEYANGAPLSSTSFKDWDMDGEHEFEGSHMMVNEGYGQLIRSLERDLPIETNKVVTKIEFNDQDVRVLAAPNTAGSQEPHEHVVPDLDLTVYEADAVICTLPLGILKLSIGGNTQKQGGPVFEPPLPDWKCDAIRNVGYGSLNKIALMFDKPFWDTSLNLFGRLNESPSSRGEMFLFFANGENPVLTGLMAGEAASHANNEHREQLVQRAMTILQQIFPQCPARVSAARSKVASNALSFQPVNCAVTMWHLDRFSRGCYSYLSTQCSPDDFDVLARPLCD
ncbi:AOF2 protein, partial [Aphelenchoides avenae]